MGRKMSKTFKTVQKKTSNYVQKKLQFPKMQQKHAKMRRKNCTKLHTKQ